MSNPYLNASVPCKPLFLLFAVLFGFLISCEKDPVTPDDPPIVPVGYTQYGTPFSEIPATEDIVMYEVNLRAFSQAGNLAGVTARLDEIKALGVNVIWLMPIHPIGTINSVNSPYSVKDYLSVSTEYGTLQDLRALTDAAHQRGIAVIMDWIANHTAWDHPWITNGPWYTRNASGMIIHPPGTNWLDVADLNFESNSMRMAMIDAMKYWILEANVDGYRVDYADGVPFDFWKQAIDTLKAIPNRDLVLLAEGNRVDHFDAGFDLNYAWSFYGKLIGVFSGDSPVELFTTHTSEYTGVPDGKHRLRFTTNHDESAWDESPVSKFNGKQGALAASVAAIYMAGVPLIYCGQEVGRAGTTPFFTKSPINWNENPDMLQAYKEMMQVYTETDAARKGTITYHATNDAIIFTKNHESEQLLIIINARNAPVNPSVYADLIGTTWTDAITNDTIVLGSTISLTNYQYIIAKR